MSKLKELIMIKGSLIFPLVFTCVLVLISCTENGIDSQEADDDRDGIQIRIKNNSSHGFKDLIAIFPKDSVNYGTLKSNKYSQYKKVAQAYRYSYIELYVGNKKYILQPIEIGRAHV